MTRIWIKLKNRFSSDYIDEVAQFMEVAKCHVNDVGKLGVHVSIVKIQ